MSFLSLWAFWFLLLIPVAVGLYLLKLKRQKRDVSTLLFWQQILRDEQSSRLFQKLRRIFSLLLQILFILLVVLALSRPVFKAFLSQPTSRVLVLDATASMKTVEGQRSRFELAVDAARRWVGQSSFREETMILAAGREPKVACPFSSDEKALLEALDRMKPTDGAGRIDDAVLAARSILSGKTGPREIVVLSDHPVSAPVRENLAKEIDLTEETFGSKQPNLGILRFATRPLLASPDTCEMMLQVGNFGDKPAETEAQLELNGSVIDIKPLKLAPGQIVTEVFPARPSHGGLLKASLKTKDALAADDAAFTVVPEARRQKVLLVTRGNLFLKRALESHPLIDLVVRLPSEFDTQKAREFAAVVFDASAGAIDAGVDALPNSLWIGRAPSSVPGSALERPVVTDVNPDSPLNRLVSLQNVVFARAARLSLEDLKARFPGWALEAPVRSFDEPLVIAAQKGERRWVAWSFDLLDSDLPIRVAFPLMISNTLQWLAPGIDAVVRDHAAGDVVALGEGESVVGSGAHYFVPEQTGFYEIRTPEGSRWAAVNLFDASESTLDAAGAASVRSAGLLDRLVRPPWFYLTLAAAVLLLAEWWLWNRKMVA